MPLRCGPAGRLRPRAGCVYHRPRGCHVGLVVANAAADKIADAARPAPRKARPIALYLFVLALVALVPAFVFSAILLQRNNEAQERVVETLMTGTARSIVQTVEREITANITTLKVLATTPALLEGDFRAFHDQVKAALEGTGASIYLLDSRLHGDHEHAHANSALPPVPAADPAAPGRALESGDIVVSDLVFGSVSERWVVNVLLPAVLPAGRPMVLGFNRYADDLTTALLANKLPDGWNVALVDSKGSGHCRLARGAARPARPSRWPTPTASTSSSGWTTLRTAARTSCAVVQQSLLTGWTLVAWAPRRLVARPLSDAFWSLAVGGVLLAAMVVLVIYWVSLQIGRSVHGLETDAKRLGAGQPVAGARLSRSPRSPPSRRALDDASRRRQAAETEVRFLMRELAHRSKNQMTVIAAMAKQTARGADSVPEFVSELREAHLRARPLDRPAAGAMASAASTSSELLTSQIDRFCPVDGGRVALDGPATAAQYPGGADPGHGRA